VNSLSQLDEGALYKMKAVEDVLKNQLKENFEPNNWIKILAKDINKIFSCSLFYNLHFDEKNRY